jgi:ribose 5-phosphate isomerase A
MPFAWQMVQHRIAAIGGESVLRKNAAADNVAITAYGSVVLDCVFAADRDSQQLNQQLNAIPGIVEHGIFAGLTTAVFCSESGQVQSQWAPAP